MAASEALQGSEADQQKASDGMAEKLPGLIVPNLPADQQPLNDTSNPTPVSRPPKAINPDRFTPGNAVTPNLPAPNAPQRTPNATPPQGENR
jgi:hypothetical protein